MATNITTDDIKVIDDLDQRFYLEDHSLMIARTFGHDDTAYDEKIRFDDIYKQVIEIAKDDFDGFNHSWNAHYLDGISVTSEGYGEKKVLIYSSQEGGFYPKILLPNDIDWSDFDENDFVKINSEGQLVPGDVSVGDLIPTSVNNADRFLQVSSDGLSVIESTFDLDSLLNYPSTPSLDANAIDSGIYVSGYGTLNVPTTGERGYIISSRMRTQPNTQIPEAAQIFISTESDDIKARRNDGDVDINGFDDWYTLYHSSNHPISNSVTLDSATSIASSRAVKIVNDKIVDLDNSLTGLEILGRLTAVDGPGSNLNADLIDGYEFSDLDNRFVNAQGDNVSGTITFNSGNKARFQRGTSYVDVYSETSLGIIDSNNPIAIKSGTSNQRLYSGGILASDNYNDSTLVPSNGIYSKGKVRTGSGFDVGTTEVVDNSGRMSWSRLKDVPSNVTDLGTASQVDYGTAPDEVPLNTHIQEFLMPPGAVMSFAGNEAPDGWMVCDGSAISRSQYSRLYNYIGVIHGNGDGATTFNVPDMRNQFVRGSSTTRPVGNEESDMIKSHSHSGSTSTAGNHTHSGSTNTTGNHTHTDIGRKLGDADGGGLGQGWDGSHNTGAAGNHSHTLNINANGSHSHSVSINSTGGSETRPTNIALLYCIKY